MLLLMNPSCTSLAPAAVNGIKELDQNTLLLCNACIASNKGDKVITNATNAGNF